MASSFVSKQKVGVTSTSTAIYTAPSGKTGVMFSGIFSNKTSANTSYLNFSLKVGTVTTSILTNVPLMYGASLELPKIVVPEAGILYASVDSSTSGSVDLTLNILEKDN